MPEPIERVLCRIIGCSSPFAARWSWPYRLVCEPLVLTRRERRNNRALRMNARRFDG